MDQLRQSVVISGDRWYSIVIRSMIISHQPPSASHWLKWPHFPKMGGGAHFPKAPPPTPQIWQPMPEYGKLEYGTPVP